MPRHNMPNGWSPPAPAWQSHWKDQSNPLVAAYFGVQADTSAPLDTWALPALRGRNAPFAIERGRHTDPIGPVEFLYVAYWRESEYCKWWADPAHSDWWLSPARLSEGVGYWREVITMPFERLETLHSTEIPHGVGVSADLMDGPIIEHGYPGGMRDRIPKSEDHDLRSLNTMETRLESRREAHGARIWVKPPEHMCVIRSGQNWSVCEGVQRAHYLEKLHPVLQKGMRFLREHPLETNCYTLRFVETKDAAWQPMEQSFGLGYGLDVHAFENWAKSHPTHLAIFSGFLEMVEVFGAELQLSLWHEVTTLPAEGCEFEYIACDPRTGLLPYI